MADNEISLLGNIRDSLRDSNKKAAEDAAAIEDGVLTQKQMLKAQKDSIDNAKKSADEIAFKRNERQFYNLQICEQENGHFGDTIIRQFLCDSYFKLFYLSLADSKDETLSALAHKSLKEVEYHLRHSSNWVLRLGDGTKESNDKIQQSLNQIWKYTGEFFEMDELDNKMLEKNIGVDNNNLKSKWDIIINKTLNQAKLSRPEDGYMMSGSKKGLHTEFLGKLLAQMQYLPRAYPNAKW